MVTIVKPTYAGRVKVAVIFEAGNMRPVWFVPDTSRSAADRIMVGRVNQVWNSSEGITRVIHFAVSAAGNDYILTFNTNDFTWTAYVSEESGF